nr:immunoglobulin heavy chain junction region [Mus musculus]
CARSRAYYYGSRDYFDYW